MSILLPKDYDGGTSVEDRIPHPLPSLQSFSPWPDFLHRLQEWRYLHSESEFWQVPALNLLQGSDFFEPLSDLPGSLPDDLTEKFSTPSGMTMAE
jgi:hypothetical protein